MNCELDINMTLRSDDATVKIFNVERKIFVDLVTKKPLRIARLMPFAHAHGTNLFSVIDLLLLQKMTILICIESKPMLTFIERDYRQFTPKNAIKTLDMIRKVFAVMIAQRIQQKRNNAQQTNA